MRAVSILSFAFVSVLAVAGMTGCEAIESAGQSFNNWAKTSLVTKPIDPAKNQNSTAQSLVAKTDPSCPEVKALAELSSITQFANPKVTDAASEVATAKLDNVSAVCTTSPNSVTLEISLDFTGSLGPVGVKDLNGQANYTYPYFLTVVTPNGLILSKDVFALSMSYDKGNMSIHKQDRLRQTIPLMPGQVANKFQIVAGFQLSPEELAHNRASQGNAKPASK